MALRAALSAERGVETSGNISFKELDERGDGDAPQDEDERGERDD